MQPFHRNSCNKKRSRRVLLLTVTWKRPKNKQSRNRALTCRFSLNFILLNEDHDSAKFARMLAHKKALPSPHTKSFSDTVSSYIFTALDDIYHAVYPLHF
ncbi:hypothetical protein BM523_02550 [Alteromonas mediterranea]|uniref:Uncharacterized protein n=1 Tax=Alteromonas mediterranea TaxID=314275 RepID=A0AAC9J7V5_9ALTE|nr:hypothetical protein BM524_02550 [Alteromonas mediterranea]APD92975.1 hypothetical protein BM523_02550 [Alteromonas mediterranea]APD96589.1 hypothetical protein BM525_02535 [Alteromonas mediterranea]APE00863.1 hypothetical protein BM526_02695 [Alteromonas mediterranea]QDG33704.1 hypothetical protein FJN13_02335 [Alteromonas mediterranea]